MSDIWKTGILAVITMAAMAPASAQAERSAEWWLVMDDSNPQIARFVDLASIAATDGGAQVSAMALSPNGYREMKTVTVDCEAMLSAPGQAPVKEFICGTSEYRESNGLILGPVSPDEMAAILFAAQSDHAGGNSDGIA